MITAKARVQAVLETIKGALPKDTTLTYGLNLSIRSVGRSGLPREVVENYILGAIALLKYVEDDDDKLQVEVGFEVQHPLNATINKKVNEQVKKLQEQWQKVEQGKTPEDGGVDSNPPPSARVPKLACSDRGTEASTSRPEPKPVRGVQKGRRGAKPDKDRISS